MDTATKVKKKSGRRLGQTKMLSFGIHAFSGRGSHTSKMCALPARNKEEAETKGRNFCTMVGVEFSHVDKEPSI